MHTDRRRRDKARMRRRARRLYAGCTLPEMYADRLTSCSCVLCGNPRRHFKALTYQEKRFLSIPGYI